MTSEFSRDAAMTAVIFGFFAMVWFGWAQEHPPRSWKKWLIAGSVLAPLTLIAGGLLAWRLWNAGTAFDGDTGRTFGIIVGIEFALAGLGSGLLAWRGRKELMPVWIALVVGVHLFPLAPLLHYPLLYLVAALVTIAALVAVPVARRRSIPVSAVNGVAAGAVLLAAAIFSLADAFVRA
jgi:hypothetical protein